MAWANSTRASRLPPDWARRRARVLRRDPVCTCRGEADGCQLHPGAACSSASTDADHLTAGDDHSLTNLGGKCHLCHVRKTIAERPKMAPRKRPTPRHPGLTGG